MLEDFMGPEEFRIGVKRFLEKYKYGNAVTADLWHELTGVSSSELNITRIMDTWTRQMGYPVLTVSIMISGKTLMSCLKFLLVQKKTVDGDFKNRYF